jgi:hypothetical protein
MTGDQQKNVAASVRQRLFYISREQREDFQLILIRFALERSLIFRHQESNRTRVKLLSPKSFKRWLCSASPTVE